VDQVIRLQATTSDPRFTGTPQVKTGEMLVWHRMTSVSLVHYKGSAANRCLVGLHLHSICVPP
ncbi:hypothetical protein HAX54_040812, partial [Datura stramonium]|nr:hypothetical protein [Datura stramonium]